MILHCLFNDQYSHYPSSQVVDLQSETATMPSPSLLFLFAFLHLAFFFLFFFFFFFYLQNSTRTSGHHLPPGPHPLPVIGNLHCLGPLPHRDVAKLSETYGPILYLRLGSTPTVFISSPALAEQVFKDTVFANRSVNEAIEILFHSLKDFSFEEYGPRWRKLRKLCVNNLLSSAKIDSYEFIRREEVRNLVDSLKHAAKAPAVVDVTAKVRLLFADMVCRMLMGRKWAEEESVDGAKFSEHIHEMMLIMGSFNLNDAVPWLGSLDLQGLRRRARAVKEQIDGILEEIIDEHVRVREEGKKKHKDFVDILLDSMNDQDLGPELDRTAIKAIILDMFLGAMDTSPVTIDWALSELLRHPEVMKKARKELDNVVGVHRPVEEFDIPKLSYLSMVIKESFRLHQIVPFVFRHTKKDVALTGYNIPGGADVMVCVWAMGRDKNLWKNAEEFIPERFENSGIDVTGHNFSLLPFGSGRRICPGMSFALLLVPLVLAQLVHCFDWELPDGVSPSELDMKEKYGLTMPRAVHLHATPVYRLVGN